MYLVHNALTGSVIKSKSPFTKIYAVTCHLPELQITAQCNVTRTKGAGAIMQ